MVKKPPVNAGDKRGGFNPWVGKIPWGRAQQPIPVFSPGESYGQRGLAGCSPWGHTKSDTTEVTQHSSTAQGHRKSNTASFSDVGLFHY